MEGTCQPEIQDNLPSDWRHNRDISKQRKQKKISLFVIFNLKTLLKNRISIGYNEI